MVWKSIHCWTASIGIVGDEVPSADDCGLLIVALSLEKARRCVAATLRGCATSPFPITFTIFPTRCKAELRGVAVIIGFDSVGDYEFTCAIRTSIVFVELLGGGGDVVDAKTANAGINGHREFAIEDAGSVVAIDVNVVFPCAGIVAIDYVFEVFVDK